MAVKSSSQITISDITDAYSVTLSSEAFTLAGSTSGAPAGSSCKTSVTALRGGSIVPANVGTTASNQITFKKADGSTSDVLVVDSIDTTTNPNQPEITFKVASGKTLTEPIEAIIPVKLNNNTITITKKFTVSVAKTGTTGKGISSVVTYFQTNNNSTAPSAGTSSPWSTTPTMPSTTNHYMWAYDYYTYDDNTHTSTAVRLAAEYTDANKWYSGTAITGTSTTPTTFSGSGITNAVVNDHYLNTSTGNTYICTTGGNASTAKWKYEGSIKGTKGDKGDTGDTGPQGPQGDDGADAVIISILTDNGDCFKNSEGNTTMTPEIYVGGVAVTISDDTTTTGKFPVTINGEQCYLYWYHGDTKLTSSNTGSAADKYGEFPSTSPYGRLKVYAIQVTDKQPYTCKIEDQ